MVRLRLSCRLLGRVDDSDVLQESFLEISKKLPEYVRQPVLPFFLWLRHVTGLKLAEMHRRHLGTQLRDADREVSLHRGGLPEADSVSLAAQRSHARDVAAKGPDSRLPVALRAHVAFSWLAKLELWPRGRGGGQGPQ